MAEMKFSCPKCSQLISCDELWSGHQIQCPTCQAPITVPAQGAAAATPGSKPLVPDVPKETKLSIGQARHAPSSAPPQASANSTLARSAAQFVQPKKKGGGVVKAIIFVVVFAVCAAGGYFGFKKVKEWQDNKNAKDQAAAADSGGGEFGHAKNLYDVLDATDPGKMGRIPPPRRGGAAPPPPSATMPMPNPANPAAAAAPTAIVAPIYSLDTNAIKIPESKVNGKISGTNFVADGVRFDPNPAAGALVLHFYQGSLLAPDRDILIYLHVKPGEKVAGHNWFISPDMKGAPTIYKRWKAVPTAPQLASKMFSTGYAMDLQLGQIASGQLSGKIFLSLPDPEQSVIAGVFQAATKLPDSAATATSATSAPPARPVAK